jgi:hypothetical protein
MIKLNFLAPVTSSIIMSVTARKEEINTTVIYLNLFYSQVHLSFNWNLLHKQKFCDFQSVG